ncbi:hypothetical protein PISL3812_04387 [Talaromyces islandicus]|uniref:Zn(2)-C6 fungal-type domain-containing protein n=1 Tax=Talaromyces islandicus TaxID=28573 RepID=A0A0U1LXN0_TALIS|nr:hypothetical protein PISL3812_04387 [Talaromyces islandicus]
MGENTPAGPRRITKAFHHKSRNGCRTCKTRRVKCDEKRPMCGNCTRMRSLSCVYDAPVPSSSASSTVSSRNSSPFSAFGGDELLLVPDPTCHITSMPRVNTMDLPETASRRKMELRLLHTFMTHLSDPYPNMPKPPSVVDWLHKAPELSLEHDNLLYMMHASSAAYLIRSLPDNKEVVNANHVYLALALREQQKAVADINRGNCEALLYAAMFHFTHSFSSLWNRSTDPYIAPTDWLRVGKGVATVMVTALGLLNRGPSPSSPGQQSSSAVINLRNAPPVFQHDTVLAEENLAFLPPIPELDYICMDSPSPDAQDAYDKALRYLGSMYLAVTTNEPVFSLVRRFMGFPMFVPALFIDLVAEHQPRALVILAMVFALMTRAHEVWWVGEIPQLEVLAIQKVLPQEWQGAMEWPLLVAGLRRGE